MLNKLNQLFVFPLVYSSQPWDQFPSKYRQWPSMSKVCKRHTVFKQIFRKTSYK